MLNPSNFSPAEVATEVTQINPTLIMAEAVPQISPVIIVGSEDTSNENVVNSSEISSTSLIVDEGVPSITLRIRSLILCHSEQSNGSRPQR